MGGGIQLIYVDPPFYSGSNYQASIRIESPYWNQFPPLSPWFMTTVGNMIDDVRQCYAEDYL